MLDDEIEEQEEVAAPVENAPGPEVPAEAEAPAEPEEPDFGEGLLDPENGKLLGKFNDANALARSYKDLESHNGRTLGQAAEYKKALAAQGYTFDDAGKPVPPAPAPAPPPVSVPAERVQDPALPDGQQMIGGVLHDHLGLPIIPQEEWDALEEEDPRQFQQLWSQQQTMRIARQEQYNAQQAQRQQAAYAETVSNVRTLAREKFFLDDDNIKKIEDGAQEVLKHVAPHIRVQPQAYEMAMRAVASDMLPGIYQQQLRDVIAGNKEAVARAQRVVALEKGTQHAPAPAPVKGFGLSADEKLMAKQFGMTEEDYAKNK